MNVSGDLPQANTNWSTLNSTYSLGKIFGSASSSTRLFPYCKAVIANALPMQNLLERQMEITPREDDKVAMNRRLKSIDLLVQLMRMILDTYNQNLRAIISHFSGGR
ncbi:MAG: hypothetical protein LBI56_00695 [Puniceicoccales bacterium]|jgi:hypothetical protein|nr:hypothetical protein [Puniceicoccales bacterium]